MSDGKKTIIGTVVSDKMNNTATVEVTKFVVHPLYRKRLNRKKKYTADNTLGAVIGQKVEIVSVRPLSKTKRWKIQKIVMTPEIIAEV